MRRIAIITSACLSMLIIPTPSAFGCGKGKGTSTPMGQSMPVMRSTPMQYAMPTGYSIATGSYIPSQTGNYSFTPYESTFPSYHSGSYQFQPPNLVDVRSPTSSSSANTDSQSLTEIPDSERASRANKFYTQAAEAEKKGDLREAKALYNRVVQFYDDTPNAAVAKMALDRTNRKIALSAK
jgi:hypothetical protein